MGTESFCPEGTFPGVGRGRQDVCTPFRTARSPLVARPAACGDGDLES